MRKMAKHRTVLLTCMMVCALSVLLNESSTAKTERRTKPSNQDVVKGKMLFRANGCFDCHSVNGQGSTEGVSLSSVGLRRDATFLKQQLLDPEKHVEKNKKSFNSEPNLMTNPNLSSKETDLIVTYLRTLKKPVPKKGERSKDYNSL